MSDLATARRLYAFGRPEIKRLAWAAGAGTAAAACVVALMGTSGWLIDRAAQHPGTVLALSVATASVRGFAIGRGTFRYGERILSHDAAFRVLARVRVWLFDRLEVLVPGAVDHSGDALGRMVGDADAVQNVWLRLAIPASVVAASSLFAIVLAGAILPVAGIVLAAGLLVATVSSVGLSWTWGRRQRRGLPRSGVN